MLGFFFSYGFAFKTHKHGLSKPVVFGFVGNFFPMHKIHFSARK